MKSSKFMFSILLVFYLSIFVKAQQFDQKYFQDNPEIYFSFNISEKTELTSLTKIISIDKVIGLKVFAYSNEDEFKDFLLLGYEFEILTHPGKMLEPKMSSKIQSITEWNVYPTYDAYVNMMYKFADDHPDICQIIDAGNSVLGRKILFAKISDNVGQREAEPQFMYSSTMHGDETTGYILMLRLIDSLLTSYGTDTRITNIINNIEIWINPLANPDGTYYSADSTVFGAIRYNAMGYDLNRNFPDPVNGVHPEQQKETTVFRDFQEANNFSLIANFHGGIEVVNYPWDRWVNESNKPSDTIKVHADQVWYQFISHLYADTCQLYSPEDYMTVYDDGITNGGDWYVISGGRQDYTNYYTWGREVTIEISDVHLIPADELPAHWEYNKRSLLNYMETVLYGVKGIVTDNSLNPLRAKVTVEGHDMDNSEVWSDSTNGFYLRMLEPGTYSFNFQSEGFKDTSITDIILDSYFSVLELNIQMKPDNPVSVSNEVNSSPDKFSLDQNYPNPFNPGTTIQYSLPEAAKVKITVNNIIGQQVAELVNEFKQAGTYIVEFDGANLSSGVYIYKLEAGSSIVSKKMTLLK